MRPAGPWRALTRRPKSAASNSERLPPRSPERWHALLGRKISIRYRLPEGETHPFSEAVGVVLEVSDDDDVVVKIMKRDGKTVAVQASAVLAGKAFPP